MAHMVRRWHTERRQLKTDRSDCMKEDEDRKTNHPRHGMTTRQES